MDFRVTEDQDALRRAVRSFCEARMPPERLHELAARDALDRALWRALGDLGVFGTKQLGLGAAEAVLAFAELGRRLVPGPLVFTHLAAQLLPGAADGQVIVGGLDVGSDGPGPILIEHLSSLDVLLVLRPDGIDRIDPRGLDAQPVETPLDPLTPVHLAAALPRGERVGDSAQAEGLRQLGTALVASQLFGIAEATQELAVAYAKLREQFGRPIGSFQAIKHMCADMFVRQELARAAVYAAGATLDQGGVGSPSRAVACAKLVAEKAADLNARACLQIHGGMGYTWEVPVHFYLKRAWVLRTVFGTAEQHAERLAAGLA